MAIVVCLHATAALMQKWKTTKQPHQDWDFCNPELIKKGLEDGWMDGKYWINKWSFQLKQLVIQIL